MDATTIKWIKEHTRVIKEHTRVIKELLRRWRK